MTEITDLSTTDASNTEITGESLDGNIANMGRMDNTLQAILGMLARSIRTNVFRIRDNADPTKQVAINASGITTATTRTLTVPDASGTILVNASGTTTVTSADAGATAGPILDLYRDSATPATNDILGKIIFNGEDSAGNTQEYGSIEAVIADPTSTSEDGVLDFYTPVTGTRARRVSIGAGVYTSGATGGDQGTGTVNATGVYRNGVELTPVIAYTAAATTSGSAVTAADDIPSWVTQIALNFNAVSTNGSANVRIQLGDASNFITTGYNAVGTQIPIPGTPITEYTDGFGLRVFSAASAVVSGTITFTRQGTTNGWFASGNVYDSDSTGAIGFVSGSIIMSNALTRLRVITTDTFDAGSVSVRAS